MRARAQIFAAGRQATPYMMLEFTEDVNMPEKVYVTGKFQTEGLIITTFKRIGSLQAEVKNKGAKPWTRRIHLPFEHIGGYSNPMAVVPTNPIEVPVQPNDPVNAERWLIEPIMTGAQHRITAPPVRPVPLAGNKVAEKKMEAIAVKQEPTQNLVEVVEEIRKRHGIEDAGPGVFQRLKTAVRAFNEVLAELPAEPVIHVEGRKVRVTIPLD